MTGEERYNFLSSLLRCAYSSTLSFASRLNAVASLTQKTFHLTSVAIFFIDAEHRYLCQRFSSISANKHNNCLIPFGEGLAGRCADTETLLRMHKAELHRDELIRGGEVEYLAVPIRINKRLCGVITLAADNSDALDSFDQVVLEDILKVIAGIFQSATLEANFSRQVRNLTILSDLGRMLNRAVSPIDLIKLIMEKVHSVSASSCTILRLLKNNGFPTGLQKKCRAGVKSHLESLILLENEASEWVMEHKVPLLRNDLIDEKEGFPSSVITVPLRYEEETLGTLTLFGKELPGGISQNFDEEDRELFESMALIISNALYGAVNYQHILLLSAENDQKFKELSLLYRISNTMLSTIRLNKLIHLILTALTSGMSPFFDRAMLFLINERSGMMQGMLGVTRETAKGLIASDQEVEDILASRWNITEQQMQAQRDSAFSLQVRGSRLPVDRSKNLSSRAALEKRLIYVSNAVQDRRVDREFVKRFGITTFASAPLIAKDKVVGVVVVDNSLSNRPISQEELRFLQLFTNQAGMAIENSMLYNRIEDTNRSLRDAQERLTHGERLAAIGEMAASIAHELKGPLVSIGGFARRLGRKLPADSAERSHVDTIVREVSRLEKMLTDTLAFSRKTTICYQQCTINEIIDEALAIVRPSLIETGIEVELKKPRQAICLQGDCQQLKQVFINLFSNAQEAMKYGGLLTIAITPAKLSGKKGVAVKVADTGGGIELKELNNIFNPFYTTKETGTGLGLPIANRIVINHGGKIQVNNRQESGVEFSVILPLQV